MFPFYRLNKVLFFSIFFFTASNILFGNVLNPKYKSNYMARIYTNKDVDISIHNKVCNPGYSEVSLEKKIPIPNQYVRDFSYLEYNEMAFYNPYLKPDIKTFLKISFGYKSDARSTAEIPLNQEIPRYAKSIGIITSAMENNPDILYFFIKEGNRRRKLELKAFKNQYYVLYILSLGEYKGVERTLEKLVIRHKFLENITKNFPTQAAIGPISFYDFPVKRTLEILSQENIYTKLNPVVETQGYIKGLPIGESYAFSPEELWFKDNILVMNIKNLKVGTLELYLTLQSRRNKAFAIRLFIAPPNNTLNTNTCIQLKLPNEVVDYQQKTTSGIFFKLRGMKFLKAYEQDDTDNFLIESMYFKRKDFIQYAYPLDKE